MTETLPSEQAAAGTEPTPETTPEAPAEAAAEPLLFPEQAGAPAVQELLRAVEALLFVACEPLSLSDLVKITEAPKEQVKAALERLTEDYAERGFTLRAIAGGYQFVTPEQFAPLVERLYRPKYQQLSAAALEALAIISYKHILDH